MITTKQINLFLQCINDENYYDAHEALEKIWFDKRFEKTYEVKLLKGFINASVSFELGKRGKHTQAKQVWINYLKYRQLLFKISSPYLNQYNTIIRVIETKKNSIITDVKH